MRVPVLALITALVAAPLARAEEPEVAVPKLGSRKTVRIDTPEGNTTIVAVASPSGRHLAVCLAPRSDPSRRSDTWTSLRLIDLRKASVTGSWDDLAMGGLPPAFSPEGALMAFGSRTDGSTLTVSVLACATARGVTKDVQHAEGSRGFAEIVAVSSSADRVAVREPADADGRRHLMVWELARERRIARYPRPRRSVQSPIERVLLTGPQLVTHTAEESEGTVDETGIRVVELDTSRTVADVDAVGPDIWRFALTPDRKRLLVGMTGGSVESVDLATGARANVLEPTDALGDRFDVLLSNDGKRVVAWSSKRGTLVARDLAGGDAVRVDTKSRMHLFGVSADGHWAYVALPGRSLVAVDLVAGRVAETLQSDLPVWARVTADGRYLIAGVEDDKGWTFSIQEISTP